MPISVSTRVSLAGWHSWPHASDDRKYLAALHRHLFDVTLEVDVRTTDRDVEFHDLRDFIIAWWGDEHDQVDRGSCEAMTVQLVADAAANRLTARSASISEDGECWATWWSGNR